MDTVQVKQVIVCTKQSRGNGSIHSPIRKVTEVCDFDGQLIAEEDPFGGHTTETMLDFLKCHYKDIGDEVHKQNLAKYFIGSDE